MSNKKQAEDAKYRAPALDKGLDILELLARQPGGMTRSEIVKALSRGPSEVYRMIERLVAREYVSRSPEGDRYALTMKLFLLGSAHPPLRRLSAQAQPLMDTFAETTHQSIHLAVLERESLVVLAQASSPENWEFGLRVGARLDLILTSSGKTVLAFQSAAHRRTLIQRALENRQTKSLADENKFATELDSIRSDGFRISPSGQLAGVTDISAPVLGDGDSAFGVLTCPHLERLDQTSDRSEHPSIDRIRDAIVSLANEISISQK